MNLFVREAAPHYEKQAVAAEVNLSHFTEEEPRSVFLSQYAALKIGSISSVTVAGKMHRMSSTEWLGRKAM